MAWLLKYRRLSPFWYTLFILATSCIYANELDVYEAITTNYNKNVRPVRNFSEPVVVSVELLYLYLLKTDQKQETMTFRTELELIWKDENIGWNASQFGGTSSVMIPSSLLWKPTIILTSGENFERMIPDDHDFIKVLSDGTVRSQSPGWITNNCKLSIEDFPFDVQVCYIVLASYILTADQVNPVIGKMRLNATIDDGYFKGNEEWTLVSFDKKLIKFNGSDDGQQNAYVVYRVELRRQPIYYICVLLIPTFVTATICLLGLFVPAMNTGERVEKVNIGLTTLLSMGVILGIVAGEMPKTTTLPLLGFYVLAELVICTIGVIVSMVIMVAHQRASTRALIPPRWLNKILFINIKANRKTEKRDVTKVYTEKAIRPLSKEKKPNAEIETIKNSIYTKQLKQVLSRVEEYIDDKEFEDNILLQWIIIFDRIDIFCLIVFNTVNVVLSTILFH